MQVLAKMPIVDSFVKVSGFCWRHVDAHIVGDFSTTHAVIGNGVRLERAASCHPRVT
jgi:hypothetical protein